MKIKVEVSQAELAEMGAESVVELQEMLIEQLDDGVTGDDGEAGQDWMSTYTIEVVQV